MTGARDAIAKAKGGGLLRPHPGNWNRDPWNRGKAFAPKGAGLSPVLRQLVTLRVRESCSQEWLAQRTGFSQSTISSWERGEKRVPLAYVEAAAKVFGKKLILSEDIEA